MNQNNEEHTIERSQQSQQFATTLQIIAVGISIIVLAIITAAVYYLRDILSVGGSLLFERIHLKSDCECFGTARS